MSNVKIILFASKTFSDGSHPLMIRATANRKRKFIGTGLRILAEHWDDEEKLPNDNYTARVYKGRMSKEVFIKQLTAIKSKIDVVCNEFQTVQTVWTSDEWVNAYTQKKRKPMTVLRYFDQIFQRQKTSGKMGNAMTYFLTRRRLASYIKKEHGLKEDCTFSAITPAFLIKFKEFYEAKKNKPGTISIYLRTIRSLYNKAIIDGYAMKKNYPFDSFSIPTGEPFKRAMSKEDFIKFKNHKLEDSKLEQARDYFLFSFYTRGMNFCDMAELKLDQIKNNTITYRRKKTMRAKRPTIFNIKIMPQIENIVQKYSAGKVKTDYLFPIINPKFTSPENQYYRIKKIRTMVNKNLRIIARLAGIEDRITIYNARHSFATLMKIEGGVSTELIQEYLGHKDAKTTETYLKSFGNPTLDRLIEETINY